MTFSFYAAKLNNDKSYYADLPKIKYFALDYDLKQFYYKQSYNSLDKKIICEFDKIQRSKIKNYEGAWQKIVKIY